MRGTVRWADHDETGITVRLPGPLKAVADKGSVGTRTVIRRRYEAPRVVLRHNLGMALTPVDTAEKPPKRNLFQVGNKAGVGHGRPKLESTIKQLLKSEGVNNINTLVEIRDNKKNPASARMSAAIALQDRGFGKPREMPEEKEAQQVSMVSSVDLASALD